MHQCITDISVWRGGCTRFVTCSTLTSLCVCCSWLVLLFDSLEEKVSRYFFLLLKVNAAAVSFIWLDLREELFIRRPFSWFGYHLSIAKTNALALLLMQV
jgi:hypothetical protein